MLPILRIGYSYEIFSSSFITSLCKQTFSCVTEFLLYGNPFIIKH